MSRLYCHIILRHWFLWCLTVGVAFGQTNEELFREYQFNFNPPGARAGGMGGAFIGGADDATASFSNPAGLAFLNETAITLEYRHRKREAVDQAILVSPAGAQNSRFEQDEAVFRNVNFVSVNTRWRSWYFGIFQYNFLDEEQRRSSSARVFTQREERVVRRNVELSFTGTNRGIGVARRFGSWKLGLSVNYFEMEGKTKYRRDDTIIDVPPAFKVFESQIDDNDRAWGYSLGIHHEYNERLSWGAVWREHPNLQLKERFIGSVDQVFFEELDVPFVIPDAFGLGIQYKVLPQLRILLDGQRVFYTQLLEDGFRIVESFDTDSKDNYSINDSDELHLGVEWLLPFDNSVLALRGGYFFNPLHAVTYKGDDIGIAARFEGGGLADEHHFTMGVGWVLQNRIEVDVSANIWKTGREFTLSFIWRNK